MVKLQIEYQVKGKGKRSATSNTNIHSHTRITLTATTHSQEVTFFRLGSIQKTLFILSFLLSFSTLTFPFFD